MFKKIKTRFLVARNAILPVLASLLVQTRACATSILKNAGTTAWDEIGSFYFAAFWPVWGVLWILFVWGPQKFKEVVKGVLIVMPIVYFVLKHRDVIEATGQQIANWFIA